MNKWQNTTNVMADIFEVPAGLIMRVMPEEIEVLVSAHKEGNPYEATEKARLNTGLYCETVMASRAMLHVPNALQDEHWKTNPDVALNMISYLGVPLLWPDEEVFGTICVLDNKTRQFHTKYVELLWEIKKSIENDFKVIEQQARLLASNEELIEAIARQKRDADQLQRANEQLNLALASVTQMQAELLRAEKNAALGALVAGVAHELSTPIGNCLMTASTLQHLSQKISGDVDQGITRSHMHTFVQTVQDGMELLMRNLGRAGKLVGSFKQIAVDPSSMPRSRFNLRVTVDTVCAIAEIRSSGYQVLNLIPSDIEMDSYASAFGDVLSELLDNALRHAFAGREQGAVTISAQRLDDGRVQLSVRDDGNGIAPEDIGRVFDPFFTTRLGQGGSGLGLHTAYNLVTCVLHGTVAVESTPGAGTCFTLTMPQLGSARLQ
ncbi:GAF domain-containing sensor histidine kinase [Andreprevotia chitinilytica]|uniref:GAF domain-containing sensor histidine kinase n=1 Tax=Andreprevotia chitinilytica TaxID=396808 RepID=UPI001B807747|nr:GAF domain-containing sensor histidine kinase [Andreprevotia chitinilytica]